MRYIVTLIAVLLMVISAFGVVAPERLVAVVIGWPPGTRLYVARRTLVEVTPHSRLRDALPGV